MSWFKKLLTKSTSSVDSNKYIVSAGKVARFSFDKRDFFSDGSPKPRIFSQETHPDTGRIETSVCGLNGVSTERVWFLGNFIRSPLRALAAVEISVLAILQAKLQCEAAPEENYAEHGVIVGWDEDKSARLSASQELVNNISNIMKPN